MKKFEALQQKVNSLINSYENVRSLKGDIIKRTSYIGERLANEQEYEGALAQKKHDEERNKRTMERIKTEIDIYKSLFKEILDSIELEDQWLELPMSAIKKTGDSISVYESKMHFNIAQSYTSKSSFKKPNVKEFNINSAD